jgi:hypothetical protein
MKNYELSEFISLLRLGVWCGGEVGGIGYVSAARSVESPTGGMAGVCGLWLGGGVMLEGDGGRSEPGTTGTVTGGMTFSVFDPYTGRHNWWAVDTDLDDNPAELISAIIKEAERAWLLGPRLPREHVSLQNRRRHVAQFSSMRGGSLPTIRRK